MCVCVCVCVCVRERERESEREREYIYIHPHIYIHINIFFKRQVCCFHTKKCTGVTGGTHVRCVGRVCVSGACGVCV